jgi:hypothetical protein
VEISGCFLREFPGQKGPGFAGKVMISDIRLTKGGRQYGNQFRMTVAQIEDAAVDVKIDKPFSVGIKDIGAFPLPDDKINADLPEGIDFPRTHIDAPTL